MVVCNVCGKNKQVEKMHHPFRYVCEECWNQMAVSKRQEDGTYEDLDKEQLY